MSVASISRAFTLLRAVPDTNGTLSDLASHTGIPIATVSRVMNTLESEGAVLRDDRQKAYRIGPTVAALATSEPAPYNLGSLAASHLDDLATLTNETAGLVERVGTGLLHTAQVASDHDVAVRDWTGVRVPAHSGCIGFVMMASWTEVELDAYLATDLEQFAPATVTDPATIRSRLRQVQATGWLSTTDEYAIGVTTVAAAIRDSEDRPVGALHVHGPTFRFPSPDTDVSELGELVSERAKAISAVLGWSAP